MPSTDSDTCDGGWPADLKWSVSVIGARDHYAVARAFATTGRLRRLYTDIWKRGGGAAGQGDAARRLAGRWHAQVPDELVTSFNTASLWRQIVDRFRAKPANNDAVFARYMAIARAHTARVNRHLLRQPLDARRDAFYGFLNGSLETLVALQSHDVLRVLCQFDPGIIEENLVIEEQQRWPGWEPVAGRIPQAYWERLTCERDEASVVLTISNFARQACVEMGVEESKLIVVPLAYEPTTRNDPPREKRQGTLRVLWLGNVIVRKGIGYLLDAARALGDRDVQIDIVGPVGISEQAVRSAPDNVHFVGPVDRARTDDFYKNADLFVLPTVSDSFAITQLEAMARGLPVIATPNCGDVVTHERDGLIVPIRDSDALAAAIARLDDDRDLLASMSHAAVEKSRQFSLTHWLRRFDDELHAWRKRMAT